MSLKNKPCAVLALGGNAIAPPTGDMSVAKQFSHTRKSLRGIIDILKKDYLLAITHGNGPQVGAALRRVDIARSELPDVPLGLLVADTEGSMGYMIEQSLFNLLRKEGIKREVVTIVTQVLVDRNDSALANLTKFVGRIYTEDEAKKLMASEGWQMKPFDKKGGWRQVVGSPKPISIINSKIIKQIVHSGVIAIVAGGGGIPVYDDEKLGYEGVDAVIDKDLASSVVAKEIDAQDLIILTNIDRVRINYGTDEEKAIDRMTLSEAKAYFADGHFPPGSMGPKVQAAMDFVEQGGERAIICDLDQIQDAIQNKAGTLITK